MKLAFLHLILILTAGLTFAGEMRNPLVLNEERISPQPGPLQEMIDQAKDGDVIAPPPGIYHGPIVISKPITIDGKNKVEITGDGAHHAVVIYGNHITLRNLHLSKTGHSTEREDACLLIEEGSHNIVEDNIMDECFFGIDLKKADENTIKNNQVFGQEIDLGMRGDGIRLWYSMGNIVSQNQFRKFKDLVVWYSHGNQIKSNVVSESRYSLHFMFSQYNLVESNHFAGNSVGVYVMYTEGVEIKNNYIASSNGPAGMAVGFKEASNVVVEGNDIVYCAIGVGIDLSPFQPDTKVYLKENKIAYNSVGVQFNSKLAGIEVIRNLFEGNIDHLSVSQNESASANQFNENYWDTYEGFDRNADGFGDRPYEMYSYIDKIWMDIPMARFFKNSPLMEFIDFLEQLAPFSSPTLLMKDEHPVVKKEMLYKKNVSQMAGSNG